MRGHYYFCEVHWEQFCQCKFYIHLELTCKRNYAHDATLNLTDVIFGKLGIEEDYFLFSHILLLGKYYLQVHKEMYM